MKECCVDLEIAKELKENGFPQNTILQWRFYDGSVENSFLITSRASGFGHGLICHAPTSDEILKALPIIIRDNYNNDFSLRIDQTCDNGEKNVTYWSYESLNNFDDSEFILDNKMCNDKKLPNALAKMWLYVKKEGYINV